MELEVEGGSLKKKKQGAGVQSAGEPETSGPERGLVTPGSQESPGTGNPVDNFVLETRPGMQPRMALALECL